MDETLNPICPILFVDDDELVLNTLRALFAEQGFDNTMACQDSRQVERVLDGQEFAAVVLDMNMPVVSGSELLPLILQNHPGTPVIVLTGGAEVEVAVQCMKEGAFDYILKPPDPTRLFTSVRHAIEQSEMKAVNRRLRDSIFSRAIAHPEHFAPMVTRSPLMLDIFRYVEAIAPTSLPILVTGETGVGKELMARAIHQASGRKGAFIAVNVAGLDDTLFSDTLFGHRKGSFTGAASDREGMVTKAAQGTLFLDEIGDLSIESQIRLLRLLQEREFYPLGSDVPRTTDARFIFATNHDLETVSTGGKFRKDLYYRLQSHHISVPPIRERPDDIPLLVEYFIEKSAQEIGRKPPRTPPEINALLSNYRFPGNIRELEGILSDAVVRHKSGVLSLDRIRTQLLSKSADEQQSPTTKGAADGQNPYSLLETLPLLRSATSLLIDEAMRRTGGNQTLAAHLLGMSRTTLNKRLQDRRGSGAT